MDEGATKALFILVGIIIFGIFVVIAYWLFEDQIQEMLNNMMTKATTIVNESLTGIGGATPPGTP